MSEFRLRTLDPTMPEQYLACVGLTRLACARLWFEQDDIQRWVPVVAVDANLGAKDVAAKVVAAICTETGGPDSTERPRPTLTGTMDELTGYVTSSWRADIGVDWTCLGDYTADRDGRVAPHRLIFMTKALVINAAYNAIWNTAASKSFVSPSKAGRRTITASDIEAFYRAELVELLNGHGRTLNRSEKSIGSFSLGDSNSNVTDGSGLKFIDALVEVLALASIPVIPPMSPNPRCKELSWALNTQPMTVTGLAALQRTGTIPGLMSFRVPIVSVGKGYFRFDFQNIQDTTEAV